MWFETALPYQSDASAYFVAIRDLPWSAWLDSGGCGRYDILVAAPVATITAEDGRTILRVGENAVSVQANIGAADVKPAQAGGRSQNDQRAEVDPFSLLREQLGEIETPQPDIPFVGGALGYWSYDLARRYQRIPSTALDAERLPDMAAGIYDWAIIVDHQLQRARLVSRQRYAETAALLPHILQRLQGAAPDRHVGESFRVQGEVTSNLTLAQYRELFEAIRKYLHEGDCYQVNLAQRFSAPASGDAFAAYLALRRLSPAPYAAFLDWPQVQVLCASPELFLRVNQGRVETRPIKGTRARLGDSTRDREQAQALQNHRKDRAENLMIVDLLRNDLGKNCKTGSVRTPRLFEVESFSNVHHLVSTVEGVLREDRHAVDLLRDCFPGGSITGAPKQRAMEIIEQLEPNRRGIYCGAIGYIGFDGNMQTNIAIRTLVHSHGELRGWAGGGIVADSECNAEYQETRDKASAMLEVMRQFGGKLKL